MATLYPHLPSVLIVVLLFISIRLQQQDRWAREQAELFKDVNNYWGQVAAVYSQLDGLYQGYIDFAPTSEVALPKTHIHSSSSSFSSSNASSFQSLDFLTLMVINAAGDMLDLTSVFREAVHPDRPPASQMNQKQRMEWIYSTHCSALIKVSNDLSDIFAGLFCLLF